MFNARTASCSDYVEMHGSQFHCANMLLSLVRFKHNVYTLFLVKTKVCQESTLNPFGTLRNPILIILGNVFIELLYVLISTVHNFIALSVSE